MADLSLVIINDDAAEYCPGLFRSISEQIPLKAIDIVFIDNCSRDDSVQIAENFGAKKIFRFEKKSLSRGVLYNKGLELAEAPNVIFAHSDIYFAPDFFSNLSDALKTYQNYNVICFAQYYSDTSYFGNEKIGLDLNNNCIFYRQLFKGELEKVEWLLECSEACFMINRACLGESRFNENYKNSFHEFDLFADLTSNACVVTLEGCKFTHYFIELHEKILTSSYDVSLVEGLVKPITMLINEKNKRIDSLKDEVIRAKKLADSLTIKRRLKRMMKSLLLVDRWKGVKPAK